MKTLWRLGWYLRWCLNFRQIWGSGAHTDGVYKKACNATYGIHGTVLVSVYMMVVGHIEPTHLKRKQIKTKQNKVNQSKAKQYTPFSGLRLPILMCYYCYCSLVKIIIRKNRSALYVLLSLWSADLRCFRKNNSILTDQGNTELSNTNKAKPTQRSLLILI